MNRFSHHPHHGDTAVADSWSVFDQAKVVDPATGETLPLGATGELMIRGSCVMHGYWDDPEKTDEVISQDGWYRTG